MDESHCLLERDGHVLLEVGAPILGARDASEGMCAFAEKRKPVYTGE